MSARGETATVHSLREICELARGTDCGQCTALAGDECVYTTAAVSVPATRGTAVRPARGYHMTRFARAEAGGLITAPDMDVVLEAAGSFTPGTVVFDNGQSSMRGAASLVLGPFETSSEAILALRPADGSFTGREALFGLLKDTLHVAGVELRGWDWTVLRWLADLDVQTVAAVAGWVARSGGQLAPLAETDGIEPYCTECGSWVGMFYDSQGWHHFRGDPAPGGQRELFDAGHEASPAWCQPPGRFISPAGAVVVGQALEDAERCRRHRATAWCADCQAHPAGACDEHVDQLDQADVYRALAAELDAAGRPSGEGR
jgi:hypothetical protein